MFVYVHNKNILGIYNTQLKSIVVREMSLTLEIYFKEN